MTSGQDTPEYREQEKTAIQQLEEKEASLSSILHNSKELIVAVDVNFNIIAISRAYQKTFDPFYAQEPEKGLALHVTAEHAIPPLYLKNWLRVLKGEEFSIKESVELDGKIRHFEFNFHCIRNQYGEITGASQQAVDITAKLRQQQTEMNMEEFGLLANAMPQLVWTSRMDGSNDFMNDRISQYTGVPVEELLERSWKPFVHPDDLTGYLEKLEKFRTDAKTFEAELRIRAKDHTYRWFICKAVPLVFSEAQVSKYLCTATDIHEQKLLLAKLEQKAKELEQITEAIPQLVWTTDAQGFHTYFNNRWYEYTGLSFSESVKEGWLNSLHPQDLERTKKAWKQSLSTGTPYYIEYRFRKHDGTYRWFIGQAVPLRNSEGEIIRWFGTCTDSQEQKLQRDELDQKNQKLFQINRYLDEFVHAVAHDLRSPVAGLKLSFELLSQIDEDKRAKIMNGCQTYVDRLDNTLKGLVQLIEVQEDPARTHHEEIDIQQVIDQILNDLQEKLQLADATVKYGRFQWRTIRYPRPYIYNIIRNIVRYALRFRNPEQPLAFRISSQNQNGFLRIRIEENGPGINLKKEMKNLFKPFSHINKGSDRQGMGLAIVKHMVEKNGGKIEVKSILGQGTRFDVYLKEYSQI